jgi:hypothetical protein
MTATNGCLPDMYSSREEVALSGLADVPPWRDAPEQFDSEKYPDIKLLTQRVIVYPKLLDKLGLFLTTGNIWINTQESRWPAYEAILT